MDESRTRVAELATEVLDSLEKLEIVLHLARAGGHLPADRIARELRGDPSAIRAALDTLAARGVIVTTPAGHALAKDGAWAPHVEALVAMHDADRMEVLMVMSKAAVERLREQAARAFSDAFVIRPKKGGKDG